MSAADARERDAADLATVVAAQPVAAARPLRWGLLASLDPLWLGGSVLFLAFWWALTGIFPTSTLPGPASVAQRIAGDFFSAPELTFYGLPDTSLLNSIAYTAENVLLATVIGAGAGIASGLMAARLPLVRAVLEPIAMTAGTVPILVAAPFFLIWFGVGRASAVLLVTLYVAVILYVFAQRAADNLDPVYEDAARTLGADRRRILRDILLPGTVPQILGGIRIALAGCWGLEAIAELLGSQFGIGKIIEVLAGATDVQGIFAALLVLGVVAVLCDMVAALVIARIAAWSVAARPSGA
ncbi:MAG: ABC transporter permease subunit [Alphaproteobacteria bacterium]|nr:ABC transporter permease subunit [Alphaproteobacteria bacterium]